MKYFKHLMKKTSRKSKENLSTSLLSQRKNNTKFFIFEKNLLFNRIIRSALQTDTKYTLLSVANIIIQTKRNYWKGI